MELFLKGVAVGLAISIPMGSVGVFVIHRVIAHNKISAYMVGFGSMLADFIFGVIAIYGLTAVTRIINEHRMGLGVFGGALLMIISINIFFSKPKEKVVFDAFYTLPKDFGTGFLLTITNPLTVLAILALFAWFGLNNSISTIPIISATITILGFMVGLLIWWFGLINVTTHFKNKLQIPSFKIVNQIFGVVLFALSILVLVRVI